MANKPKTFSYNQRNAKAIRLTEYTYDNEWRKLRNRRIREEPLCRHCNENGHITIAVEVDHIIPRAEGGKDEWDNTQSLCKDCHQKKTTADMRRIRRGY